MSNSKDVLTVFHGRSLRSGIRYLNLESHLFTLDEHLWICKEIKGETNHIHNLENLQERLDNLCQMYHLAKEVVSKWIIIYDKGELMRYSEELWLNHRGWRGPPSAYSSSTINNSSIN